MRLSLLLVFLATLLSTSHARSNPDNPIRLLRRPSDAAVRDEHYKINCQSFRVGVEAYNLRDWYTIPSYCKSYIKTYLEKKQWGLDVEAVAVAAIEYADTFEKDAFLKDVWVFDVEDTLLSNLDYLASSHVDYGTKPIGTQSYYEWLVSNSTAVPAIQYLYDFVSDNGFEIVILSGAPESLREKLVVALQEAGYSGWANLILKSDGDNENSMLQYKSKKRKELVDLRYRIAGNVGDQWSDLSGENAGLRTFKVPNPVYYVA